LFVVRRESKKQASILLFLLFSTWYIINDDTYNL